MYKEERITNENQQKQTENETKSEKENGGENMTDYSVSLEKFSLSEFIQINKDKIKAIATKNPTISKDDEWRDEDIWEEYIKEK